MRPHDEYSEGNSRRLFPSTEWHRFPRDFLNEFANDWVVIDN
jgi:hypothetical protein